MQSTGPRNNTLSPAEAKRLSTILAVSLLGFFTAGWFLSRSYSMVLFVNTGLAAAVYQLALGQGLAPAPLPMQKVLKYSFVTAVALILIVYVILRITNLVSQ